MPITQWIRNPSGIWCGDVLRKLSQRLIEYQPNMLLIEMISIMMIIIKGYEASRAQGGLMWSSFFSTCASRHDKFGGKNIHSWERWLEGNFVDVFLPRRRRLTSFGCRKKSHMRRRISSNWNKQWIFLPALRVLSSPVFSSPPTTTQRSHMAHSPLNWWDFFSLGLAHKLLFYF